MFLCPDCLSTSLTHSNPNWQWWLGLNAAEQAAWAAAAVGLLAAAGGFAAALASFFAAKTALRIAKDDRAKRLEERDEDSQNANLRAALLLQAAMAQLVAVTTVAHEKVRGYIHGNVGYHFGGSFGDDITVLGASELERIGQMHTLAKGVSGDFADSVLRALAWSRETSTVIQKALTYQDKAHGLYYLEKENMDALFKSYAILLTYARRARDRISDIAGDELEVDDDLLKI
jgi:hypothetical protein